MKNLWSLWCGDKLVNDTGNTLLPCKPIADYLGDYVFTQETMQILNEDIKNARTNVPAKLGSFPRDLDHYKTYKAADWKAFLKLFGTSLLYCHLPDQAHRNFIDLYDLWVSAISHCVTASDIADIKQKVAMISHCVTG